MEFLLEYGGKGLAVMDKYSNNNFEVVKVISVNMMELVIQ
jgi:hypothetical protein